MNQEQMGEYLIRIDERQEAQGEKLDKLCVDVPQLRSDVDKAKGAWKATTVIGGVLMTILSLAFGWLATVTGK